MSTESKLQRLFRNRFESQRKRLDKDETSAGKGSGQRNDSGVGVTGVVVTIVILAILAAVGGPPLFSLIFDAREFKLENNVQEAAQVLQQRLTLAPDRMNDGVVTATGANHGGPNQTLITDLVEDAPYTWEDNWTFSGTDNDETIRVQFLQEGSLAEASGAGPTAGVWPTALPPTVDWLGSNWRAVRLHARNSDGRWACALIVVQAEADATAVQTPGRFADPAAAVANGIDQTAPTAEEQQNNTRLMNAWMNGIWYDSGDVITADSGRHDCSPVDYSTGTTAVATLPESSSNWEIEHENGTDIVRTLRRAL